MKDKFLHPKRGDKILAKDIDKLSRGAERAANMAFGQPGISVHNFQGVYSKQVIDQCVVRMLYDAIREDHPDAAEVNNESLHNAIEQIWDDSTSSWVDNEGSELSVKVEDLPLLKDEILLVEFDRDVGEWIPTRRTYGTDMVRITGGKDVDGYYPGRLLRFIEQDAEDNPAYWSQLREVYVVDSNDVDFPVV